MGHTREDITDDPALWFWSVYSYLIAFVPAGKSLAIVSILHGARDPKRISDQARGARSRGVTNANGWRGSLTRHASTSSSYFRSSASACSNAARIKGSSGS